jgi:hypothetical protein
MQPVLKPRVQSAFRRFVVVLCAVAEFAVCLAAKDFVRPAAQPAKTYPAHDDHTEEKVAIAADPYDTPAKAKIFSVNFHEHGFLPIFIVVTNDGNQPISLANLQVTLTTANRDKLTPASPDEPHNTQSGFLFFDVEDISAPLAGAHIYVTGVDDAKGTELMYFEVPLEKYLNPPNKAN